MFNILGAVSFKAVERGSEPRIDQFKINNELNTVIGVQVNFNTEQKTIFEVGQPFIDPLPSYYAIRLPISLESPILVQDMTLEYEVFDNEGKLLFASNKSGINFAPKTKTNLAIPWEYKTIKNGETYIIKGNLSYNDSKIGFEKDFEFSQEQKETNETNDFQAPTVEDSSNFPWWIIISLSVLALLVIFLVVRRKFKKNSTAGPTENEK